MRISLCLWLVGCAVASLGCSNKAAQVSRDKAAEIWRTLPSPSAASTEPVEERRVYIDASLSMKGFVNPEQRTPFNELIEYLGDVMPGCRPYKYGAMARAGGADGVRGAGLTVEAVGFGLELRRPEFYGMTFNPDDRLIKRLVEEERPALSVMITDGVYSEPEGATSPPVVEAVQSWVEKGRAFGLFMLKSPFTGRFFYSERAREMRPIQHTIAARPFYAFVFSPTEGAIRELQEKLKQRFPEMQSYVFADSAMSCAPALNERLKGTYSYARPPKVPYHWHMFDSELFEGQNPAPVGYNVKCSVAPDYPVSDLRFDLAAEYYRWAGKGFEKADVPQGYRFDLRSHGEDAVAPGGPVKRADGPPPDFVVYFPRDQGGDYGFYHLRLGVSPKALRPEITELSTRDDREAGDAGKTYRFFELMSSLTEAHFKSRLAGRTASSIFVTIQNH